MGCVGSKPENRNEVKVQSPKVQSSKVKSKVPEQNESKVKSRISNPPKNLYGADLNTSDVNFSGYSKVKVGTFKGSRYYRDQGYAQEENNTKCSKLISNNSLMNYELDTQDGVTSNCKINTFEYKNSLNHVLYSGKNIKLRKNQNYQNNVSQYDQNQNENNENNNNQGENYYSNQVDNNNVNQGNKNYENQNVTYNQNQNIPEYENNEERNNNYSNQNQQNNQMNNDYNNQNQQAQAIS